MDDRGMTDPVVRCMSCNKLIFMSAVRTMGCCSSCGNKRVQDVRTLSVDEMAKLREKKVSEDFLSKFEEVPDVQTID